MLLVVVILWLGMKVIDLFLVALPLFLMQHVASPLSILFSPHVLWLPLAISLVLYSCVWRYLPSERSHKTCWGFWEVTAVGACKRVLFILFPSLLVGSLTYWTMERGCLPCTSTPGFAPGVPPPKPALIAHRGCGFNAPENSIAGFELAVTLPGLEGLETDIQLSLDGVAFLMHDPFLVRTTDVRSQCHTIKPRQNASLFNFNNGTCPLHALNIGKNFVKSNTDIITQDTQELFSSQLIPTFRQFLEVAKNAGKSVLFDLSEPPVGHPHHKTYLNLTLKDIHDSGIPHNKVKGGLQLL